MRIGNILIADSMMLVSAEKEPLYSELEKYVRAYNADVIYTNLGMDGLALYEKYAPHLILIDSELPDMSGMSLASIIKKSQNGRQTTVALYNVEHIINNTSADHFFMKGQWEVLKTFLYNFYQNNLTNTQHSAEILRLREQQYQMLPAAIQTDDYIVSSILSPYSEIAGDSFDYWRSDNGNLYGVLYDCRGHDLVSFSQVLMIHTLFKKDMKQFELGNYQNLNEVIKSVNSDLFATAAPEPDTTAAIVFYLDVKDRIFHYCTAGMPGIFIRETGKKELSAIESQNFLLGFDEDLDWEEQKLTLDGIDQITICSDGLYELTKLDMDNGETIQNAKHDDVSAIIINIKEAYQEKKGA